MKPIHGERAKFDGFQLRDGAPQRLQRRRLFDARQREMRVESPIFRRDPQGRKPRINILHQRGQRVSAMHAHPKHARMMRIGEPSQPLELGWYGLAPSNRPQRGLQLRQLLLRPFADKLQRHMQVVHRAPLQMRARTQVHEQPFQPLPHFFGQVNPSE